jgi:hypothetical protein
MRRPAGRDLYQRNLRLLSPFLIRPTITLRSLRQQAPAGLAARLLAAVAGLAAGGGTGSSTPVVLRAEWRLATGVRLPWRPYVVVEGATEYTLSPGGDRIAQHVESWDLSPAQALGALLRPGVDQLPP